MKKFKALAMMTTAVMVGSIAITAMAASTTSNTIKTQSTKKQATIGAQKAKEIALAHAGLKAENVTFEKAKLEYEDNRAVYDVEFYTNGAEYEYEIQAVSGAISESHKENRKTQSSSKPNSNNQTSTTQKVVITSEKAKEAALAHAGLKAQNVSFEKVELDKEDGVSVYEVEFRHNGMEYNYEVNATSGAIVEFEVDRD